MLTITGIKKSFGKTPVLRGLDLSVDKGDVVAVIGPSGSGKTTLLRCINFLERADEGRLTICGQSVDLKTVTKKEIYRMRRKTAMVFQNYCLFNNKTVLENVTEALIIVHKKSKSEAGDIAVSMLRKVGLEDKLNAYPAFLSGGQQQRVGIARAMAQCPDVILLDEPTSALDPELVGETLSVIRHVAKSGITMIIVTHEMQFAAEIANKIVFMDDGGIVEQGASRDFFLSPKEDRTIAFLARFNLGNYYSI
ncbi:MAG: amino acid ABC transporter ATP-binding protein [Oscillospiraceae bacterium]|jgi:L-cystine transport system ATP-binding protein|nr:amino acid ABC transporter ATP-binding protein [Oscillospiraceae bacterium]